MDHLGPGVALPATSPDPLPMLGALALVLLGARLGAALMRRLGQPEVLGELLAGIVIGNLGWTGLHALDALQSLPGLDLLAQIGVLFLLFMIGLESDFSRMIAVGLSSLLVAVVGVVVPGALGFLVARAFHPGQPELVHVFVGAALCATSVGITARVLAELRHADTAAGRIILGAAVIDDVLGLIALAVVAGLISSAGHGAGVVPWTVGGIVVRAIGFLAGAIVIGRWISRHLFRLAAPIKGGGVMISLALVMLFALSWLAGVMGLAPIVGAFAAGLVVEEGHYESLRARDPGRRSVGELLEPLAAFLVPVFFVRMGMLVNLSAFLQPGVAVFALALTLAAVIGKQASGLGVVTRGVDRLAVGFGMIPRGEVGLIFAGIGASLTFGGAPVIDARDYAAVVAMVTLTTLIAPPLLAWRIRRSRAGAA